jgi:thiol-disulfide isomerase/thioredoxin
MRTANVFLATAALTVSFGAAAFGAAPVPRKAPEFVIQNPDGKQQLLTSYRGKVVVLALIFTTCPHCQKTAQYLTGLQKEYADKGLQVLAAAWDDHAKENIQQFNRLFAINFPCGYSSRKNVLDFLAQPESSPPFVPVLVFIDRTGVVRAQHMMTGDEGPDSAETKWFNNIETGIRAEIDKLVKAGPATARN